MPLRAPAALMRSLNRCGIRRLVVGHTPHGDCPTIIKSGGPSLRSPCLEVIMADTSYSDMTAADNRGIAVAEVALRADATIDVHGVLRDGQALEYTLSPGVRPVPMPHPCPCPTRPRPCSMPTAQSTRVYQVGPASELLGQIEPTSATAEDGDGVREQYFVKARPSTASPPVS